MTDGSTAPDGGHRRRLLGTTRREAAAAALYTAILLAVFAAVVLVRSHASAPARASADGASARYTDFLFDVSCVSPRFCVSVGAYRPGTAGHARTLIESWDGSRWSITPSADAGAIDELHGVSCVSPTFCLAVGTYRDGGGKDRSLIESWDGSRWSIVSSPGTSGHDGAVLASVSCTSDSFCAAVGHYTSTGARGSRPLIESWDGARWSTAASARTPVGAGVLASVSCASASACTAVGHYVRPSTRPLAELWNGARWSIAATPGVPPGGTASISGVSCAASNSCVVTGYYQSRGAGRARPALEPLAASWDGARWSTDATPRADGTARFYGVSCAGTSDCVVTGWSSAAAATGHTLVESWDGAQWSTAASPRTTSGNEGLLSVSCVPGFCAAAGYSTSGHQARTLFQLWNGARWSIAASPDE